MEAKGSNLDRFISVPLNDILNPTFKHTTKHDKRTQKLFDKLAKKSGQIRAVVVAEVSGETICVDGARHMASLRAAKVSEILVRNLGELTHKEYVEIRLLLNYHRPRRDYLDIAEAVSGVIDKEHDIKTVATRTGLLAADVEKYAKLLDFDWDEFDKQTEELQNNLF